MKNHQLVDIVIPVYRGLKETRRCIESVLDSELSLCAEVIVVNDASPDEAVADYCQQLSERVRLVVNDSNLGFVGSVNRAMKLNQGNDVLLLNSDCEVAGSWLSRMHDCAYAEENVATVTPFSNNATICSYPVMNQSNAMPAGCSVSDLDEIFSQVNACKYHLIPTAVGSCMYIRRECLNQIGFFDEVKFGLGYGEENDFSLRAARAGWKNFLCASVFVYHQGAVSFGESKMSQMEKADRVIADLYPEYEPLIEDFLSSDPLRELRDVVDEVRLGGGVEKAQAVVCEQRYYRDSLLKNNQTYIKRSRELKKSLEESWKVIAADRESFKRTDEALKEAQKLALTNLKQFQTTQETLDQVRHELGTALAEKNYEIDVMREKFLHEKNKMTIEFESSLQEMDGRIINLESQLNEASSVIENMLNSRSWRYTKWLRWLSSIRVKKL